MKKFECKKCGYRLESDSDRTKIPCPYCGEREIVNERPAEELIE